MKLALCLCKVFILIICLTINTASAQALYDIAEPDALQEMEERKDKVVEEWEKFHQIVPDKIKGVEAALLTAAPRTYAYYVDMTYILPEDIVNHEGKVIYPKGYVFNPIAYTNVKPPDMVIFNPCDKDEVELVKELVKKLDDYMLVGASCNIGAMYDFLKTESGRSVLNQPVYMLNDRMKEKLNVKYTVSIVGVDLDNDYVLVKVYAKHEN
jgi:hypothetical protein